MLLTSQNVVVVLVVEEKKNAPDRIGRNFLSLSPVGFAVYVFVQIHTEC